MEKGDTPDDDPDALFYEKIHLTEICLSFVDAMFAEFLSLRLSRDWEDETKKIRDWAAVEA